MMREADHFQIENLIKSMRARKNNACYRLGARVEAGCSYGIM